SVSMNFLSLSFAGFGALVFAGWWGLPAKARPWLLAAANLVFAGLFGAKAVICLVLICLAGYLCGLWAQKGGGRAAMWLGVLLSLAPLAAYKYLPLASPALFEGLVAPVGLSFYVFKTISYLADVAKGRIQAEKCPL